MAKKKTESNPSNKKKRKNSMKKSLSASNAVATKPKPAKENPFEAIWSRRKFDILGKKRRGEERRVGLARSRGIDKRKRTLLKEYEQSNKSSVFVDKRIGEQNDTLGEFDKAILRFQRERQVKLKKQSKYNLSDGEEDDFGIQVGGSFSERDDFEDGVMPDDEADEAKAGKNSAILEQLNASNMDGPLVASLTEGEEKNHKTKKEVMEEIISKSKFFKAQKAKEKEENEQLMEQLDKEFSVLVQTKLFTLNKRSSNQEPSDNFDKLVKEMALDMRARPSDRTKTPEEIAQEEKERLEWLEEERKRRMLAADESGDEDNVGSEDVDNASAQRLRPISGDDLGHSFSFDEKPGSKRGWVDEVLERKDPGNTDDEDGASSEDHGSDEDDNDEEVESEGDDESAKTISLNDWEQSDDDKLSTDLEEEEEDEEEDDDREVEQKGLIKLKNEPPVKDQNAVPSISQKTNATGKQPSNQQVSLPYTIEAPNNFLELCTLLDNRSDDEIVEAVRRIRMYNSIALAVENRKKIQVFYGLLLQYFAVLANKRPLNFKLLNLLVKPLVEMSAEIPYFAAICARQRIFRTRVQFCNDIKNTEKSCWPSLKTLFLLRLWSMIFPCSDFRHAVMTPVILLMCEYLMRCPIKSARDIAVGTFLCSMVLSVCRQSKKFFPEPIIFLRSLLMSASRVERSSHQQSGFYHLMELSMLESLLCLRDCVLEVGSLDFHVVMDMPEDSPYFSSDSFRASMLVAVVETLRGFVNIYGDLNSFPEIFLPISSLLHEVENHKNFPDPLHHIFKEVSELIDKKANEHCILRQPLQMRKKKPVPIKQLNPKFEENFVKGRDYDPDRERVRLKKLKKLLKQEAKGAARELRKDNYFLLEVKEKDRALLNEERAEKYGKARAFLQEQEHAFKSGQLGKGRKRRR